MQYVPELYVLFILKIYNPANGKVLGNVPVCDTSDAILAIESAKKAFDTWSALTAEVFFFF